MKYRSWPVCMFVLTAERTIIETIKAIDLVATQHLKNVNLIEHYFWERLKNECLVPSSTVFGLEKDLKRELLHHAIMPV